MSVGEKDGGKTCAYRAGRQVDRYDLFGGGFSGTCQHKMLTSFDSATLAMKCILRTTHVII